jgi:type I restriction enzyme M protein
MAKRDSDRIIPEKDIGYVDVDRRKVVYPFLGKEFSLKPEEENRLIMVKKLILEYGYSANQLGLEVVIKSGQTVIPKKADVVIFDNATTHDPASNAYIIVEVKKKQRTDGIDQMQTYCNNTTAEFGVWFNGKEIIYQHRRREPHKFEDIPDIPRKGETLEDVGFFNKEDLVAATELRSVFETIHNHIYANEGLLKEKVFNEMLKIIFVKMADEKSLEEKAQFRITERELRQVEGGNGSEFSSRIEKLFDRVKREYKDVFDKNESINLKPGTLAFVVSQLQRFSLRDTEADVKGTAFQTFVYAHQRGDRGEFFTPRPVVDLMVKMIDPGDSEVLLDPACGSGGFLVYGMNYVWDKFRQRRGARDIDLIKYAHNYVKGIDFNPDLAKVSKMHMVLYDDGHTGIFSANSLEEWDKLGKAANEAGVVGVGPEEADVILTNPPFGSKGKVTDKRILSQFDLGHKWRLDKKKNIWVKTKNTCKGQVPDILFIERSLQFLRPGGRLGIVLPNSDLNNLTLEYVRSYIKDHCRILAVVSLPVGTFASAGSNPQPSVLFLQKLPEEETKALNARGYPIFMAAIEKIGYDLKSKNASIIFKKDASGELMNGLDGLPIVDTDTPDVINAFANFKKKHGSVRVE